MITCEDCGKELDYGGRGRPPKYCPDDAKAHKRKVWQARPNGGHKERADRNIPQCCLDAKLANQKAKMCDQHRQWRAWQRSSGEPGIYRPDTEYRARKFAPNAKTPQIDQPDPAELNVDFSAKEPWWSGGSDDLTATVPSEALTDAGTLELKGCRIIPGDKLDSWFIPDRKWQGETEVKCGYDARLEKLASEWLRKAESVELAA